MNSIFEEITNKVFVRYVAKCVLGTFICYIIFRLFPEHQTYWSIISVLMVLAPEDRDSFSMAAMRMKANIAGAAIGILFFLFFKVSALTLCVAIVTTLILCTVFKLKTAARSAMAALVIVLVTGNEKDNWIIALDRMVCVIIGCLVAILLTWLFAVLFEGKKKDNRQD